MWKVLLIFSVFFGYCSLGQSIKVSVYYETLCPDSVRFLVNQFYPVFKEYAADLEVDLVAYGKATSNNETGSWVFDCQHGQAECYGNKVHSCAIELYDVAESTEFVVCAMASGNASLDVNLQECATASNVSWAVLEECISSGVGDELLVANGRRTDKLIPDLINFVPTIVINDVFKKPLHTLALSNFPDTFAFLLDQVGCGFCQFNGSNGVLSSWKLVISLILFLLFFQKKLI